MVTIELSEGPLEPSRPDVPGIGALLEFHGIVRDQENGKTIAGLEYQVYEPMTTRELSRLATQLRDEIPVESVLVRHSFGFVPAGKTSFYLAIGSRHRQAGLQFAERFISEMKALIPIWKVPIDLTQTGE